MNSIVEKYLKLLQEYKESADAVDHHYFVLLSAIRPEPFMVDNYPIGDPSATFKREVTSINDKGRLSVSACTLSREEALAFAEWIKRTFTDEQTEAGT